MTDSPNLVDDSVKALFFSLVPPLNIFGGGGWFLEQHGRLGVHARRIAWTQTIITIICILCASWVAFAISQRDPTVAHGSELYLIRKEKEKHVIAVASLVSTPFVAIIGTLAVANIVIAAVSFQYAKSG